MNWHILEFIVNLTMWTTDNLYEQMLTLLFFRESCLFHLYNLTDLYNLTGYDSPLSSEIECQYIFIVVLGKSTYIPGCIVYIIMLVTQLRKPWMIIYHWVMFIIFRHAMLRWRLSYHGLLMLSSSHQGHRPFDLLHVLCTFHGRDEALINTLFFFFLICINKIAIILNPGDLITR